MNDFDQFGPDRRPARVFNPTWVFAAIIAALVLLIVGVKVSHWRDNRVPFGPDAVTTTLTGFQITAPPHQRGARQIAGRLDISGLSAPDGSRYWLIVIDNRTQQVVSLTGDPTGGSNAPGAGSSWDGGLSTFAQKYSWLKPLAEIANDDATFSDPGETVSLQVGPTYKVPFTGVDKTVRSTPLTKVDLTVALLLEGPDQQAWWAKRLN